MYTKTGNRIGETRGTSTTIYTHIAGNRIQVRGTETFTHDNNGNIKTVTTSAGTTTYTYDYDNRLVGAAMPDGTTAAYKYDPLGRRIQKAVNTCSSPGSCILSTVSYFYDGDNILYEYDEANVVKARYTHNLAIDDPLAMEKNGQVYYYHKDALGSISSITDSAGNVVQRYDYDAFGNITSMQNPAFTQPYAFTGREYDAESGLYFYRARTYNSVIGRFMQEDPLGFDAGDVNLYRYVWNSPLNWIDPSGQSASFGGCVASCAANQFGITTLLGATGVGLGSPILSAAAKPEGATQGTSIASKYLSQWFPRKIGSTWAPTLMNPLARTATLGRVLGRWVPIVGYALLAKDAYDIGKCTANCQKDPQQCP